MDCSRQYSRHESAQFDSAKRRAVQLTGLGVALTGLVYGLKNYETLEALAEQQQETCENVGRFIEGLPVYKSEDVAKHQDEKSGIWISYKNGVYDITSFIQSHPGM